MCTRTSLVAAALLSILALSAASAGTPDPDESVPPQPPQPAQPAQPEQPDQQANPQRQPPAKPDLDQPIPPEQLLLARTMATKGMDMLPNRLAKQFDLSDPQKESARQILQNRWNGMPQADQDNLFRAAIYGRQLRQSQKATSDDWQRLAKESLPAVESMLKMMNDASGDFEKVLTDEQRVKFDEVMADFREGQQDVMAKFKQVADGQIKLEANGEPAGGWKGSPDDGRAAARQVRRSGVEVIEEEVDEVGPDGSTRRVKVKRIKSSLPDEETVAGDERYWTPFLKGFVAKFNLDADQQKAARQLLGERLGRARAMRLQDKVLLDDARKRIAEAEAASDARALEAAHAALDRLNQPIVATFRDLQRQLDNLLTAQQREAGKGRGELFGKPAGKN